MQTQMKKYEVKIKQLGDSPLLWNRIKKELMDEMKQLKKNEMSEWEQDPKNWQRKAEFNGKGVMIPEVWLKSMIYEACKKTRMIPHFATRKSETYSAYISSFMIKNIGKPVCKAEDLEGYAKFVNAQGKMGGGKILRYRPLAKTWQGSFEITDPAGRMKKSELKDLIEYGGMFIGLGDDRKDNFGRFEVMQLKETKK